MSTLIYLKNFIKDKNVASVTPTSSFGVRRVCGKIDFGRNKTIVEYGPATGVFTRFLLRRMRPDASLILIEINKSFVDILRRQLTDPRVTIAHDSASNVDEVVKSCGFSSVDTVISGIPFSFLSEDERSEVLRKTHQVLAPGGKFLAYQTFYQMDDHLKVHLLRHFRIVEDNFEILNLPPMRIYEAVK
jgi:phospholipid N-methyltransferase